jgi:hypothetical protein
MNKRLLVYVMTVSLLVLGCQPPLYNFANDMYQGNQQLTHGQYSTALASFLKANNYHPSAGALAFAAMAAYKMSDRSVEIISDWATSGPFYFLPRPSLPRRPLPP